MVSLILVPSLYLILQDLGEARVWLIGRGADPEAGPAGPPTV